MNRPIRVELVPSAIWVGILVTHVAFCLVFSLETLFLPPSALNAASIFLAALMFGAIPAVVVGLALGHPLGVFLQPVRNQWWHVGAFALLGGIITMPFGVFEDPPMPLATIAMIPATALGRFSVWRLARIRNDDGAAPPLGPFRRFPAN
ncbi:hypothetical protein [Arthrobacter sp. BPSS-3]|uniref:hypothetical protein n=1 Tax=Arthrobacter sp. BPSS-3 TaxID=3366580 RepID=UPI0037DCE3BF